MGAANLGQEGQAIADRTALGSTHTIAVFADGEAIRQVSDTAELGAWEIDLATDRAVAPSCAADQIARAGQILQALFNLLRNAAQALEARPTGEEARCVWVIAAAANPGGGTVSRFTLPIAEARGTDAKEGSHHGA